MTMTGSAGPLRHPEAPLRMATYDSLDKALREAQDAVSNAKKLQEPEPGIKCRSYKLPTDLGEPTCEYRAASPRLHFPVAVYTWRDPETGKVIREIHRFRVGCHGFDD